MRSVGLILGVLVLVVVGTTALQILNETTPVSPEWEFDDYRVVPGAVSASGALELVQTHLGETVHARDVGTGTITHGDGTIEEVTVSRALLDVFLITGQSNSAYYQADPAQADPLPRIGEAYAWATATGSYGHNYPGPYSVRPVVDPETGSANIGDKCPSFCSEVNGITGNKVLWICGGWGGVSIDTFNPDGGAAWTYTKETVDSALAAIDDKLFEVNPCSFIWIQGETDRTMAVDVYERKLLDIVDAITHGELGWTFDHCFISLITEFHGGNARQAQIDAAEANPGRITIATEVANTFTEENGLMSSDGIHYSQLGDNIVGRDLGVACGEFEARGNPANRALLDSIPVLMGIAVGVLALGLVVRAIMGRD